MRFEYIKQVSAPVLTYGGQEIMTGDFVDFDGHLARKALANTAEFRQVPDGTSKEIQPDPVTQTDVEAETYAKTGLPAGLDELRAAYQAKFGTKPHHKKSAATLTRELTNGD